MIVLYALFIAGATATELWLYVRFLPAVKKAQSRSTYLLFLWVGIIPGELVGAAFVVYMIFNRKVGPPLQMLMATAVALAAGFLGGRLLLRARPQ